MLTGKDRQREEAKERRRIRKEKNQLRKVLRTQAQSHFSRSGNSSSGLRPESLLFCKSEIKSSCSVGSGMESAGRSLPPPPPPPVPMAKEEEAEEGKKKPREKKPKKEGKRKHKEEKREGDETSSKVKLVSARSSQAEMGDGTESKGVYKRIFNILKPGDESQG